VKATHTSILSNEKRKTMVSAIAIFIIAINVYIYLKNKKDK